MVIFCGAKVSEDFEIILIPAIAEIHAAQNHF